MPAAGSPRPESWWVRIRGPRAISWQSVVVGNALISVAIVFTGGTLGGYTSSADAIGRSMLAVLIVGLVASLWAVVGFTVLFRSRAKRPVSPVTYVLFYAVNATLYFAGVQYLDSISDEPSGIGWPARMLSSIAIGLAWAVAVSLLLDGSDRFHARRQLLLEQMVAADIAQLRESQEALRLRAALDAQVDEVLESTRTRLTEALDSSLRAPAGQAIDQASEAAEIVRAAATDVVRPLSHRLQERASASFPTPRIRGVLRQWWAHPRMPPLATALLVSAQTTAESVRNFGGSLGPVAGLLYFGALYLFLLLIDRSSRRFPRWERGLYAVGVAGSLVMNVGFAEGFSPEPVSMGDVAANVLLSLVYIAITSLFDAVRRAREGLLDSLAREVDAEEVRARALESETAAVVDALARELHGRVQTRLVVCAAELERAAAIGDHDAVLKALGEAASALETATRPQRLALADVVSAWESVMEVRVDTNGVPERACERSDVVAVVEEGLANAHRHGDASRAVVSILSASDVLRVVVTDDGSGVVGDRPGFGSQLLQRLSQGRMTLECGPEGTVLTVDLPAQESNVTLQA